MLAPRASLLLLLLFSSTGLLQPTCGRPPHASLSSSQHDPISLTLNQSLPSSSHSPPPSSSDFAPDADSDDFGGYYASIDHNARGETLRAQLTALISKHTVLSYAALWSAFITLSRAEGSSTCAPGTLAAMYSTKCWTYTQEQCGNFRAENDCYNREHSFPKSWWGGATSSPAHSDLFHLFPADGYDNSRRGNEPYGSVVPSSVKYRTSDGSLLGSCQAPQARSSVCFEPADAWKGVVARAYFYVSVAYRDTFTCCDTVANKGAILAPWLVSELLSWHASFPPSARETKRNEEIAANLQHNRNPFIDHPEWAQQVFAM